LHIFIAPIVTMGNKNFSVIGNVMLVENITEQKLLERSKDEFFSIASHELRTPLTAIRGNTSMIMDYYQNELKDPQVKEMVSDVHESSIRLISIVNDFLDMSRLELGKIEFKKDSLDLSKLIPEVIKEYQVTGSRKGVSIVFKDAGKVPSAVGDEDRFKQVLINLIGNGLKFTEKGEIAISLKVEGNSVKVLVSDTGMGISEENQKLLFRKFQQAESNIITRDTTRGTGLGLYISKMMVEKMGGQIKLEESAVGKGTTFSFTLPIGKS
jgi:signal transduction histidine kinase